MYQCCQNLDSQLHARDKTAVQIRCLEVTKRKVRKCLGLERWIVGKFVASNLRELQCVVLIDYLQKIKQPEDRVLSCIIGVNGCGY